MNTKRKNLTTEEDLLQQLDKAQETVRSLQEELEETNKGLIALNIELELREERFKSIFETAQEGIVSTDFNGKILSANPAVAMMLGYETPNEFVGTSIINLFMDFDRGKTALKKVAEEGSFTNSEVTLKKKTDGIVHILTSGTLQKRPESGMVFIFTDITKRKQAEEEIRTLNEKLKQNVIRLEAANKELESFSYSVSHDLRAPLRAIDGFSRILLEDYESLLPPDGRDYLQLVRTNTLEMGRLIDDLLALSRLGRQFLKKQRVDLADMVRQVFEEQRGEQEGRNVEIRLGHLPVSEVDPSLFKQVFVNLLANALKFTRKRNLAVIEVACEERDGERVFFVKDNGVGFDMKYAGKLFGVFQRLHRAEDFEGTGVGLAIVQRIIHRHGGRIWVEAETDHGAAFYFTLEGGDQDGSTLGNRAG